MAGKGDLVNEPDKSCSGWSLSTLYTHFSALLVAQKEAVNLAQSAADRAMLKAENATERRFEGVNEFRNTLADQQRTLMPRSETEIRLSAQDTRLAALEKLWIERQGRSDGLNLGWSLLLGLMALAGTLFGIIMGILKR